MTPITLPLVDDKDVEFDDTKFEHAYSHDGMGVLTTGEALCGYKGKPKYVLKGIPENACPLCLALYKELKGL